MSSELQAWHYVWKVVSFAAQSHVAAGQRPIGQPVITASDSLFNLCERTLLFSTTLGPLGESNGLQQAHLVQLDTAHTQIHT